uniref:Uncharacterized protein n=1 Tax=Babesia bovis TaxID=5865 RepID=S6BHR4_BABBO|nr:hypothetical protein [Babesia bovis]
MSRCSCITHSSKDIFSSCCLVCRSRAFFIPLIHCVALIVILKLWLIQHLIKQFNEVNLL